MQDPFNPAQWEGADLESEESMQKSTELGKKIMELAQRDLGPNEPISVQNFAEYIKIAHARHPSWFIGKPCGYISMPAHVDPDVPSTKWYIDGSTVFDSKEMSDGSAKTGSESGGSSSTQPVGDSKETRSKVKQLLLEPPMLELPFPMPKNPTPGKSVPGIMLPKLPSDAEMQNMKACLDFNKGLEEILREACEEGGATWIQETENYHDSSVRTKSGPATKGLRQKHLKVKDNLKTRGPKAKGRLTQNPVKNGPMTVEESTKVVDELVKNHKRVQKWCQEQLLKGAHRKAGKAKGKGEMVKKVTGEKFEKGQSSKDEAVQKYGKMEEYDYTEMTDVDELPDEEQQNKQPWVVFMKRG